MKKLNPVLFYFWDHDCVGDYDRTQHLDTLTFHKLVDRSDNIFVEFNSPNLENLSLLEADMNEYIRTKEMPDRLAMNYEYNMRNGQKTTTEFIIADFIKGTNKIITFEKTLKLPFDFYEKHDMINQKFFLESIEDAIR